MEPAWPGGSPCYRRTSGGGTVVQGPGCLNYSARSPHRTGSRRWRPSPAPSAFVLERIAGRLSRGSPESRWQRAGAHRSRDRADGNSRAMLSGGRSSAGPLSRHAPPDSIIDLIEETLTMPGVNRIPRRPRSHRGVPGEPGVGCRHKPDGSMRREWDAEDGYGHATAGSRSSTCRDTLLNHDWTYRF